MNVFVYFTKGMTRNGYMEENFSLEDASILGTFIHIYTLFTYSTHCTICSLYNIYIYIYIDIYINPGMKQYSENLRKSFECFASLRKLILRCYEIPLYLVKGSMSLIYVSHYYYLVSHAIFNNSRNSIQWNELDT